MTYLEAIEAALAVKSYAEADAVCKSIEEDYDAISDRQYHNVRDVAQCSNQCGNQCRVSDNRKGD